MGVPNERKLLECGRADHAHEPYGFVREVVAYREGLEVREDDQRAEMFVSVEDVCEL